MLKKYLNDKYISHLSQLSKDNYLDKPVTSTCLWMVKMSCLYFIFFKENFWITPLKCNMNLLHQKKFMYAIEPYGYNKYGKCPKLVYTKVSDKMAYANSVDQDQTAPKGPSLFVILLSIL